MTANALFRRCLNRMTTQRTGLSHSSVQLNIRGSGRHLLTSLKVYAYIIKFYTQFAIATNLYAF